MEHIQIWHYFSLETKREILSMTFIIGIFPFHGKSETKQIKWNKIKRGMWKSDSISPYLPIFNNNWRLLNDFWKLFFEINFPKNAW